jgi:hypothetical protein
MPIKHTMKQMNILSPHLRYKLGFEVVICQSRSVPLLFSKVGISQEYPIPSLGNLVML